MLLQPQRHHHYLTILVSITIRSRQPLLKCRNILIKVFASFLDLTMTKRLGLSRRPQNWTLIAPWLIGASLSRSGRITIFRLMKSEIAPPTTPSNKRSHSRQKSAPKNKRTFMRSRSGTRRSQGGSQDARQRLCRRDACGGKTVPR